jgi:hypothetical protein
MFDSHSGPMRYTPAAKTTRGTPAIFARPIFAFLAAVLVCGPAAPAIVINVDWSARTPIGWSLAAVAGIAMAAVFIESCRKVREWYWKPLLFVLAIFGMGINMAVAMKTASIASDDDRNARETRIIAANRASSLSSQSSQRRGALVAIAGETPSATYEAQIQEAINRDVRKWESTAHCTDAKYKGMGQLLRRHRQAARPEECSRGTRKARCGDRGPDRRCSTVRGPVRGQCGRICERLRSRGEKGNSHAATKWRSGPLA